MGGRMGNDTVKVKNLTVVKVYPEKNLLVVSGAIPGSKGSYVIVAK
jgi:large subunit ribosomal protein L3